MESALKQATELHRQGRAAEAEELYRTILASDPNQPDALALLGLLLASKQEFDSAVDLLELAVAADAQTPLFRLYLGKTLAAAGHTQRAIHTLHDATSLKPDFGEAWLALSNTALNGKDFELARRAAATATLLLPDSITPLLAHGLALSFLDRDDEAVLCFEQAVRLKPQYIPAWDMLGSSYQSLNNLDEALSALHNSLRLSGSTLGEGGAPEAAEETYTIHHWNLALLELLRGDFHNGFDHYRARYGKDGWCQRLKIAAPLWRGEDVRGKTLLVVGEQGLGDILMLCRYGKLLRERGANVILMAHPVLCPFLQLSDVADESRSDPPLPDQPIDFQTSIFDLPFRFKTKLTTVPRECPYLPLLCPDDRTKLAEDGRKKIGVVWAGHPNFGNDHRRSIPLNIFSAIFEQKNFSFYSLVRDMRTGDHEILACYRVVNLAPMLVDFLATARLINQLDLVICCDTSVAHLAGAMGKKTWLLLPFAPDWRWLTHRDDSPWYSTMRLFRQTKAADWKGVIERVINELAKATSFSSTA